MHYRSSTLTNLAFVLVGLGSAVLIAVFLSPFASPHPDGLNRVAEDLEFTDKELADAPARQLPFAKLFDGYELKGAPDGVATSMAGLFGTLVTFGVAWGCGKLLVKKTPPSESLPHS